MKIDTSKSIVETVGDIKEFKTGIDPKNLEFITMLLSSNLYSNPQRSFIREIVSNAWDSHVEANNTDTPVIIKVTSDSVTIRDYGIGLSPERFEKIFCNIGSSTKRDSNEFIGGFGIGRFSALACSNIVHFTSYYKGTMYQYIMVKDGNKITTNLVNTIATDEKDGLAVSLININPYAYIEAFNYIIFFPNVYIDSNVYELEFFNKLKIKRYNKYSCSTIRIEHKILLGNVLYPCESKHLKEDVRDFYHKIERSGIVINFNIGELKVTPNRESIIYDKETIDLINNRFIEAREELYDNIISVLKTDFDNIFEYNKYISSLIEYDPVENEIINSGNKYYTAVNYSIYFNLEEGNVNIKYKGEGFSDSELRLISYLGQGIIPGLKAIVKNDKYISNGLNNYHNDHINCVYNEYNIIQLVNTTKVSSKLKLYLKDSFVGAIVLPYTIDDIKEAAKKCLAIDSNNYILSDKEEFICKECYDYLRNKTEEIDFKTDKQFLDWKDSNKSISTSTPTDDIIFHMHNIYNSSYTVKFDTLQEAKKYCEGEHNGFVFDKYGKEDYILESITLNAGYKYVSVKSSLYDIIMQQNWSFVLSSDYIYNKLPYYNAIYTVKNTLKLENMASALFSLLPKDKMDSLYIIKRLINTDSYIVSQALKVGKVDTFVEKTCLEYKKLQDAYNEIVKINYGKGLGINDNENSLIYKALIKRGIRIGYSTYVKIKNNALINFVYGKENN